MIPKIIHLLWLSGEEKPTLMKKCLASWARQAGDYTVREWNSSDFCFAAMPVFVQEAYAAKKWAFVSDYLRLYLLHTYGGIYLDADVYLKKSPDEFLHHSFFSFVEYHEKAFRAHRHLVDEKGCPQTKGHIPGLCIQAAFMGAEAGHPFLQKCLDYYRDIPFILPNGDMNVQMIAPDIYALCAREFGFLYKDERQSLNGDMQIYPSHYVSGCFRETKPENYAIHCCAGSWRKRSKLKARLTRIVQKYYWERKYLK